MIPDRPAPNCPECAFGPDAALARRDFIRLVGVSTAALVAPGLVKATQDRPAVAKAAKPAESLIRELFEGLSADQKKQVAFPWDHGAKSGNGIPTRLGMFNAPAIKSAVIKDAYTKPQQDLLHQVFRAICSGDDGYKRLSRNNTFDGSEGFENIGAAIFGEPANGQPFSLVFAGHHLTVRCDGNSEPGAAFGGPMYYGHSPNGYAGSNVFYYQTKEVLALFKALDGKQQKAAVIKGTPGEQAASVRFRRKGEPHPGVAVRDMSGDQKALVEKVMRTLVSPFRTEDADEVMAIVKQNGGADAIHFAFYEDKEVRDGQPWHFWRLEGPGFVWNFRVLPHVHTYVNIRGLA